MPIPRKQTAASKRKVAPVKRRNPGGQPTKLTPAVQKIIVSEIQKGMTLEEAAMIADLEPRTVIQWSRWGRYNKSPLYWRFFRAVKKARAQSKSARLGRMQRAAAGRPVTTTKKKYITRTMERPSSRLKRPPKQKCSSTGPQTPGILSVCTMKSLGVRLR